MEDTTSTNQHLEGQSSIAQGSIAQDSIAEEMRGQLEGKTGKAYWRSLEELSDTPKFQKWMEDEFPNRSSIMQINRRDLLKFMGASFALAGLAGCRGMFLPQDKVVPYVKAPEEMVPGKPLFYATSVMLAGYATGVLVEQHEGRPIKLEGNPDHPASLGALDAISQAEILNLYDPDRANIVINTSSPSTWDSYSKSIKPILDAQRAKGGGGIRLLTGAVSSPVVADAINRFLGAYPSAKWHVWEPIGRDNAHEGATLAFGKPLDAVYSFKEAKVIVSLDSDFLSPSANPGSIRYAREFADGRRVTGFKGEMNRLYAFESSPGLVGAMADHRWPVKAAEVYGVAAAIAAAVGVAGIDGTSKFPVASSEMLAIVKDLQAAGGSALVVVGDHQPASVHALAYAINAKLGAVGKTVQFINPVDASVGKASDLKALVGDLNSEKVDVLFMVDVNPVFDAPADWKFAEAMAKAKLKVRLGLHENETGMLVDWHLPMTHSLESWGDARAFDGSVSVIQPLIAPLHDGRSALEFISSLSGRLKSGYDLLRDYWRTAGLGADYEKAWRIFVHDGILKGSASAPVAAAVTLNPSSLTPPKVGSTLEFNFRPDPSIYDGRYANNGWLQELPNPLSKLTWDNVLMISPSKAKELAVGDDDLVEIRSKTGNVKAVVFVQPGHPANTATISLGYGRTAGGVVATVTNDGGKMEGGGFNAYTLRTSDAMYFTEGFEIAKLNGQFDLATTQGHQPLEGNHVAQFPGDHREVILDYTLEKWIAEGEEIHKEIAKKSEEYRDQNLYPEKIFDYKGAQWAMTIDMNTCVGCNACVTACQAENNIPVVGKTQVGRHREMHWIRIDRYYSGSEENPQVNWQPVMCVHCEKAPCEPVCPVAATVHSHEGLNQMVYNRCVGTRYCSNNCPYKVRRFNYLNYTDNQRQFDVRIDDTKTNVRIPLLKMLNNPDVTVRGRGIMEKCTYCVQRINDARIEAKKQSREIKDGEVITACQQACPTQSIIFGNEADTTSQVHKWRKDPRAYLLLEELQTRPRTSHLAKLRNPNPEIKTAEVTH